MTPVAEIHTKFTGRLRQVRARQTLRVLGGAAHEALPAAVWVGAICRFGLGTSWYSAAGAAVSGGVLTLAIRAWRNFPDLTGCARRFDAIHRTNSRVTNAWELIRHGNVSPFAVYAVADGLNVLESEAARRPWPKAERSVQWRRYGWMLLALGLAVSVQFWMGARHRSAATTTAATVTATTASEAGNPAPPPERANEPAVREARVLPEASASRAAALYGHAARRDQPGDRKVARSAAGNAAGSVAKPRGTESDSVPEDAAANTPEQKPAANAAADDSATASGSQTDADPAAEAAPLAVGKAGNSRDQSRQPRRRKQLRRNPESALGSAQPLLADHAPPAGRELSEKDGEGDKPDSGRGGPTGEKKSRGTASMLPVTPLPDLVNGLPSPGEEMTVPEAAELTAEPQQTAVRESAPGGREPVLPDRFVPRALRRVEL